MTILTDAQAKKILEDKWPRRTNTWPIPGYSGYWLRACPSTSPMPYIHPAGANKLKTNPDGLFIYVHDAGKFADCIAIEVCVSNQNFNDKRSRYTPTSGNVQLTIPLGWLESDLVVQKGGKKKNWEASGWFNSKPPADVTVTVRHLRILFALTPTDYANFGANHLPAGHEYFCKHADMSQITHQDMQSFVKGMTLMKHFRRRP